MLAKTPVPLPDKDGFNSYFSFHFSGYQKMLANHLLPDYFTIVVKYSEDYFLYNKNTQKNEKGLHIFDIVHQLEKNWDKMNSKVAEIGIPSSKDNNNLYVSKRELFNKYTTICEP